MAESPPSLYLRAVVTGDVVGSTKQLTSARRETFADALREAYGSLQRELPDALPYPIAVFGGDSWQCYVHDPSVALRTGLYLRAWAHATFDVDTRFALALHTVDFVSEQNVAESDGAAFRASGRAPSALSGEERLAISVLPDETSERPDAAANQLLATAGNAVARLADRIAREWTAAQAQALMWRILDIEITHEEIAERWTPDPVTHQSITKHLSRGGWNDLHHTLRYYEQIAASALALVPWPEAPSSRSP